MDYLSKKRVKNDGIAKQIHVEDNHETIIAKDLFYRVQEEKLQRGNTYRHIGEDEEIKSKLSFKYTLTER